MFIQEDLKSMEEVIALLQQRAEQGDVDAQFKHGGLIYGNGEDDRYKVGNIRWCVFKKMKNLERDIKSEEYIESRRKEEVERFTSSDASQVDITEDDKDEAKTWLREKIMQNDNGAMLILGDCYFFVDKFEKAIKYYEKVKSRGWSDYICYANANIMLGWCYFYGLGAGKEKRDKAMECFIEAVIFGFKSVKENCCGYVLESLEELGIYDHNEVDRKKYLSYSFSNLDIIRDELRNDDKGWEEKYREALKQT